MDVLRLQFSELRVPLKMTFRHASAARTHGESLWVEASRGGLRGYGEGCPRPYVTGETRESVRAWLGARGPQITAECGSLDAVRAWTVAHEGEIDGSPSAWCAVEMALLDLFAQEQETSVEGLLGLKPPGGPHRYSAVLGNDERWKTRFLIDQYCILGLTDFKVKLGGDLDVDRQKLADVAELAAWHGVETWRVRVDANNLWADSPADALGYLEALGAPLFGVEEPVAPRDALTQSAISAELGVPIILDESLCTMADLERYDGLPGTYIANLKVSRVGGVLRALRLVDAIDERGWPLIVGAHVGETSVLTRSGHARRRAGGRSGGPGGRVRVAADRARAGHAQPALRAWRQARPEPAVRRVDPGGPAGHLARRVGARLGHHRSRAEHLVAGAGGRGRPDEADGYEVHYRLWGPEQADDVVVVLHGGMSHSLWQRPLAQAITAQSDYAVFAPDRRGCGLNEGRGDLGSADRTIDDVEEHLRFLGERYQRVHLAGWCQGAQYAAVAARHLQDEDWLASLLLVTPGLFWNARFRSVIDMTERVVQHLLTHFDLGPDRDESFVPVPLQATDFTLEPAGLDFIDADGLKTTELTLKSVVVMDEVQERSWEAILGVRLPVFALTATGDRIVDNAKVRAWIAPVLERAPKSHLVEVDSGHAVQFELADQLATELVAFIRSCTATG